MKESQYTDSYLECNKVRGKGNGLTIGSFLAYTLRGNAKKWISRYADSLERTVKLRGASAGKSAGGSVAYYS
ncbi:MAG TPA: hypothetical protein PLP33_24505 [Leptospiraceae bacterium]|nr:hypothetical protein [Leptospiraceae bacterium]